MNFEAILSDLKAKKYQPVYFLMGEESYYIDYISDYISNEVLNDTEKEFNQTVLYAKDIDVQTVISTAKQFPFMGERMVVIIKEAQQLKKIELLENYLKNPQESTILVFCHKYKSLDKRKSIYKTLSKKAVLFESKKLYDNQVPAWIVNYLSYKQYKIGHKASHLIAEYLGNDLNKVSNELDKLMIITSANSEITAESIETNIGISKDYNNFELTNALAKKDILKSNRIANFFAQNSKDNPLVVSVGVIFNFFQKVLLYHTLIDKSSNNAARVLKVNPYFIKDFQMAARNYSKRKSMDIIGLCRKYDMKSKGVDNHSINDGELLKEFLFKILH
ncbi:DNA polymerase III subunit delta [Flavobacteriales bacterium]|nr:DNA polymerase III subunit delta [Flavobacteriales bacterium]